MKKMIIFSLILILVTSMAVSAYAVTPALKIPSVPQISKIQFNIKLDEKLENAVVEAVKNIDFSKITFNFSG